MHSVRVTRSPYSLSARLRRHPKVVDALDSAPSRTSTPSSSQRRFRVSRLSKLRENNKTVIGVGVKQSSSDLLIANCDEFIYYDDLVREKSKRQGRRKPPSAAPATAAPDTAKAPANEADKKQEAIDLVMETVEALFKERGAEEKIWGSMVKQALKRRKPGFNESYYGFRSFSKLLDEAAARKLLALEYDEKSGGVIIKRIIEDATTDS